MDKPQIHAIKDNFISTCTLGQHKSPLGWLHLMSCCTYGVVHMCFVWCDEHGLEELESWHVLPSLKCVLKRNRRFPSFCPSIPIRNNTVSVEVPLIAPVFMFRVVP
jgi:hypothetical protein